MLYLILNLFWLLIWHPAFDQENVLVYIQMYILHYDTVLSSVNLSTVSRVHSYNVLSSRLRHRIEDPLFEQVSGLASLRIR